MGAAAGVPLQAASVAAARAVPVQRCMRVVMAWIYPAGERAFAWLLENPIAAIVLQRAMAPFRNDVLAAGDS